MTSFSALLSFKASEESRKTTTTTTSKLLMNRLEPFWYLYCLPSTYFTPFSSVSIVGFEKVNVCWVPCKVLLKSLGKLDKFSDFLAASIMNLTLAIFW